MGFYFPPSYPAQLQALLGDRYEVGNFGKSGATLLRHGHRPYFEQEEFRQAMDFAGDIVVIHLGINDTDPRNWPHFQDEFVDKRLFQEGEFKGVVVLKKGQKSVTGAEQIDALTGATITSLGVSAMLEDCLAPYKNFLMKLQGDNGTQCTADAAETEINDNQPE